MIFAVEDLPDAAAGGPVLLEGVRPLQTFHRDEVGEEDATFLLIQVQSSPASNPHVCVPGTSEREIISD